MKAFIRIMITLVCLVPTASVYAKVGDLGFFGGITEGRKLPLSTEIILSQTANNNTRAARTTLNYKEMIFLTGKPVQYEGRLEITAGTPIPDNVRAGTYTETYRTTPSATTGTTQTIDRNIVFNVNWRREGNQLIRDYSVRTWAETIRVPGATFTLDASQSFFSMSIISDTNPAVTYYKGDRSQRAVYVSAVEGQEGTQATTLETSGSFYGYESAWSSTETHRIDATVTNPAWQMQYQLRPSVSVAKMLQYSQNEPSLISFSGNYREVMQNQSGLRYDIYVKPRQFFEQPDSGSASIATNNTFEQLIAPNVDFLKGHFAESDIKKLFSMQILDGDPKLYQPDQAITRGQYTTALVKAIKLPIEPATPARNNRNTQQVALVFPDVLPDRPDYPYIMAAYKAGIAIGRDNGKFYSDYTLERQEAITILLRTLGLQNLGLDPAPYTAFVDDSEIGDWAKNEIYAAAKIGLIAPDENGRIRPKLIVSKAEASALLNRVIDYMRSELATDYADHIVNYAN